MERDELHELVLFLKEEIEAGRAKPVDEYTIAALSRVRLADDGKVDARTVDGSVRAFALAIAGAKALREMKKMPLRDVQSKYFDILELSFGNLFSQMTQYGISPQMMADYVASKDELVNAFRADLPDFASGIREFWETFGPVVETHLQDLDCMKSVFGGDIFPSYTSNIACSVGLYMDTIVLPDPLLRLLTLESMMKPNELFRYVVKHALNALGYRELALAEVEPPIVVIAPDHWGLDRSYGAAMGVAGEADALAHASRMFGRAFSTVSELLQFLKQFSDANQLVSGLADPSRLLFDVEWSGTPIEQIERYAGEFQSRSPAPEDIGGAVFAAISGRMIMTNDALLRSSRYGGSPLIDAPTSWQYLQWKYEYDSTDANGRPENKRNVLISKALESRMLSGIPPGTLIELRRNGAETKLREVIGRGIRQMDSASDAALSDVAAAVIANIDCAFSEHDQHLRAISSSQKKFFGLDVGRYVIVSGTAIASAVTQSPAIAVLSALAATAGTPSPPDLWERYRALRAAMVDLRRSPIGIMFGHLKHKFGFSS
jgi:hypothetical protein